MNDQTFLGWATVGATAVTAAATGILAWFTWVMANATKRMAETANAPAVIVTLEPSRWSLMHIDLIIENTGRNTAFDVDVLFSTPLKRDGDGKEIPTPRIPILIPSYPIKNFIGEFNKFAETSHEVSVSWATEPNGNRTVVKYNIDLSAIKHTHTLGSGDPIVAIAQEVKKIREILNRRN